MKGDQETDKNYGWLAVVSLGIVAAAAGLGWAGSFVGLHDYGVRQLTGFTDVTAWAIPGAIDGAAFATSLMTYRANIKGRPALRARLLMWAFTASSSWINWIHQVSAEPRFVAAGLPVAAVAVFDVVLIELRADYEERHGKRAFRLRPGLLLLRWMVDRAGTREAFRRQVLGIDVTEIAGLRGAAEVGVGHDPQSVVTAWRALPQAEVTAVTSTGKINGKIRNRWTGGDQELAAGAADGDRQARQAPARSTARPASTGKINGKVPEGSEEVTQELPVFGSDGAALDRAKARELVRAEPERWTGMALGERFGRSERWGRDQIKAVRQERGEVERFLRPVKE